MGGIRLNGALSELEAADENGGLREGVEQSCWGLTLAAVEMSLAEVFCDFCDLLFANLGQLGSPALVWQSGELGSWEG